MLLSFKQDIPEQKSKLEDFQNIAKRIVQADLLLNKICLKMLVIRNVKLNKKVETLKSFLIKFLI